MSLTVSSTVSSTKVAETSVQGSNRQLLKTRGYILFSLLLQRDSEACHTVSFAVCSQEWRWEVGCCFLNLACVCSNMCVDVWDSASFVKKWLLISVGCIMLVTVIIMDSFYRTHICL